MESNPTRHVRLKPYDPRRGYVLEAYACNVGKTLPARFNAGLWYVVPAAMAEYLSTVHERDEDEGSPLAFDVCADEAAATALVKREEEAKLRGKTPEDAVSIARSILTTGDIPRPITLGKAPTAPTAAATPPAKTGDPFLDGDEADEADDEGAAEGDGGEPERPVTTPAMDAAPVPVAPKVHPEPKLAKRAPAKRPKGRK